MYQALQHAYDEVGLLSDQPLTEKNATLLCNAFLETIKELSQAASSSKDQQDSITIAKLSEGMMAGERLIKHIWNNQSTYTKGS